MQDASSSVNPDNEYDKENPIYDKIYSVTAKIIEDKVIESINQCPRCNHDYQEGRHEEVYSGHAYWRSAG